MIHRGQFAVLTVGAWLGALAAAEAKPVGTPKTAQEIYARTSPAVVRVETMVDGEMIALGSGVTVGPGEVVTNNHVVVDGQTFRVRVSERTWDATVTHVDAARDLALLNVRGLPATYFPRRRSSASLAIGERVYSIGSPQGLDASLSEGVVSGIRGLLGSKYIQTTAAISHGSSGGALFDGNGDLIGITTFSFVNGQELNFAIPAEAISLLPNAPPPLAWNLRRPAIQIGKWVEQKDAQCATKKLLLKADKYVNPKTSALNLLEVKGKPFEFGILVTCSGNPSVVAAVLSTPGPSEPYEQQSYTSLLVRYDEQREAFLLFGVDTGSAVVMQGPPNDAGVSGVNFSLTNATPSGNNTSDLHGDDHRFLERLSQSSKLQVTWTARTGSVMLVDFDVRRFADALKRLQSECTSSTR